MSTETPQKNDSFGKTVAKQYVLGAAATAGMITAGVIFGWMFSRINFVEGVKKDVKKAPSVPKKIRPKK